MINIDSLIAEARKEQNPIKLEAYKQVKHISERNSAQEGNTYDACFCEWILRWEICLCVSEYNNR